MEQFESVSKKVQSEKTRVSHARTLWASWLREPCRKQRCDRRTANIWGWRRQIETEQTGIVDTEWERPRVLSFANHAAPNAESAHY